MEVRKLLNRTVPMPVILGLVLVLPIVGYFIGGLGDHPDGETISVKATFKPGSTDLAPGENRRFTALINNENDYGVRVASISEGSSEATPGGCPAGAISSAPVANPAGYVRPNSELAYKLTVTVAANLDNRCQGQEFTLPLTVELRSAAADR